MTTSLGGFDDFQGMSLWRDSDYTSTPVAVGANNNASLIYDRGSSFASMLLELTVSAFAARFDIKHFRSAGDGLPYTSHQFVLRAGVGFLGIFPMVSNFFVVGWSTPVANGNTVTVRTQQLNLGTDRTHFFGRQHQFGATGVVMPNGTVLNYTPPDFLPGPGSVYMRANGAPAGVDLRLDTYDVDGAAVVRFYQVFANEGIPVSPVQIPHGDWLATLSNFSGAAQTAHFGIVQEGR